MNVKNCLLLVMVCIATMGCEMKKNDGITDIKIKDRYEFNTRIINSPIVLEDNKKGVIRFAFVSFKKEKEADIYEIVVYDLNGKRYNSRNMKFVQTGSEPIIMAIAAIDRNGDGVDEILAYDSYGRAWVFNQDGSRVTRKDVSDDASILMSLNQFEITNNVKKSKKIVTVAFGWDGGKYDGEYLLDVRQPGRESLSGYPIVFGDEISNPILVDENIYVSLFTGDSFLDGYAIDGGKKLAGFPVELHGIDYVDNMCVYRGKDIIISDGKTIIQRMNLKDRKMSNIEIKDSKSIKNIKTGFVGGEEYIYAFDEEDNVVYKINDENNVVDKLEINIEDSFYFRHYDTFSVDNGEETYHFFIYAENAVMDVEEMFAKYAPAEEGKKIEEEELIFLKEDVYKTQELNAEQMKVAKKSILERKNDYLGDLLDEEYWSIRRLTPRTKVLIYKNSKDKIEQVHSDETPEYVFDMFIGESPELRPSIYFNDKVGTLAFVVPLNQRPDNKREETSIIKSYIFNDIK